MCGRRPGSDRGHPYRALRIAVPPSTSGSATVTAKGSRSDCSAWAKLTLWLARLAFRLTGSNSTSNWPNMHNPCILSRSRQYLKGVESASVKRPLQRPVMSRAASCSRSPFPRSAGGRAALQPLTERSLLRRSRSTPRTPPFHRRRGNRRTPAPVNCPRNTGPTTERRPAQAPGPNQSTARPLQRTMRRMQAKTPHRS